MRRQPWIVFFLLTNGASIAFQLTTTHLSAFNAQVYTTGLAVSALFWLALQAVSRCVLATRSRVYSLIPGTLLTLLLVATWIIHSEFRTFIDVDKVLFVADDPRYAIDYVRTYLIGPFGLVFLAIAGLFASLWYRLDDPLSRPLKLRVAWCLILLSALVLSNSLLNHVRHASGRFTMPLDTEVLAGIKAVPRFKDYGMFRVAPERAQVTPHRTATKQPNVYVIINESWSPYHVPRYDVINDMPFLDAWITAESDAFIHFEKAYTSATATELSVTSLLTGVSPDEGSKRLHAMPLLGDWARAAGYATALVTSQRLTWKSLDKFVTASFDVVVSAEHIESATVNDLGIDDLAMAAAFDGVLTRLPADKPWFIVVNTNALHPPYQQTSPLYSGQLDHSERYLNALQILDETLGRIVSSTKRAARYDDSVWVLTSDHCSYPIRKSLPRITSFFEESVRIPLFIKAPQQWRGVLREHRDTLHGNIDIAPTLVDAWELAATNRELVSTLRGHSWLQPIPSARTIVMANTNDMRKATAEGFGIAMGSKRLVASTALGVQLFDVQQGSEQTIDLWPHATTVVRQPFVDAVQTSPHLVQMLNRWQSQGVPISDLRFAQ